MLVVSSTAEMTNDRDAPQPAVGLDRREHLEAVDAGHQQVEQDGVEALGVEGVQGVPAVGDGPDAVALALEQAGEREAVDAVVVDDEHAGAVLPGR